MGPWTAHSVFTALVAGLAWRLRRLLSLLGSFLLSELLTGGDGVLLGPSFGLGGGLQATALQHLGGDTGTGELGHSVLRPVLGRA